MSSLHNLKPDRVIKALERAGWKVKKQTGSHVILTKEESPFVLSIPVHKGKPIKQGRTVRFTGWMSGLMESANDCLQGRRTKSLQKKSMRKWLQTLKKADSLRIRPKRRRLKK